MSIRSIINWLKEEQEKDEELIERWDHDAGRRYWLRKEIIEKLEKEEAV